MKNCSYKNCTAPARWKPVVNAYAKGYPQTPQNRAEFDITVTLCDEHKEKLKARDFIGPEEGKPWKTILGVFQMKGAAPPDYNTMFLTWEEIV